MTRLPRSYLRLLWEGFPDEVVHDFPLPDFAPLVDSIADTLQPISYQDQLSVLTKSLSLCIQAASAAGTAPPETRQVVIDLIGSLSASLRATRSTAAPPVEPPPTYSPSGDPVPSAPWFEEDPPLTQPPWRKLAHRTHRMPHRPHPPLREGGCVPQQQKEHHGPCDRRRGKERQGHHLP